MATIATPTKDYPEFIGFKAPVRLVELIDRRARELGCSRSEAIRRAILESDGRERNGAKD